MPYPNQAAAVADVLELLPGTGAGFALAGLRHYGGASGAQRFPEALLTLTRTRTRALTPNPEPRTQTRTLARTLIRTLALALPLTSIPYPYPYAYP